MVSEIKNDNFPKHVDITGKANFIESSAGGAFEAVNHLDTHILATQPNVGSADSDLSGGTKREVDDRCIDAYQNDPYIRSAVSLHRDRIVGAQYMLNAVPNWEVLSEFFDPRFDEEWAKNFQREVEYKFNLYANSTENWVDYSRQNNLTELLRMAVTNDQLHGEILVLPKWDNDKSRPYKTCFQFIDPARLATPFFQRGKGLVRNGVVKDENGKVKGYYIRRRHPKDIIDGQYFGNDVFDYTYVPVRKPNGRLQVIHLFEQDRAGQSRGLSALVSALREIGLIRKYRLIQLQNAAVQGTYAATIESDLPASAIYEIMGAESGDIGANLQEYIKSQLVAYNAFYGKGNHLTLDGVKTPILPPGSSLKLNPVGSGNPQNQDYDKGLQRGVSAALGLSYEENARDFSDMSYAAAQACFRSTNNYLSAKKATGADRLASHFYDLWLGEQIMLGKIESMPTRKFSYYETPLFKDCLSRSEWVGASDGMLDPLKEAQASRLVIDGKIGTFKDELAKKGKDYEKVFKQIEREQALMEELGFEIQKSDAVNAASGTERKVKELQDD